jgi:YHS domain-containing protein
MSETQAVAKDPVCGMTVAEATSLQSVRDGKTYYFCSAPCQEQFLAVSAGTSGTCCS